MRVLLIKTSSMGDILHTLPALTDAGNALPSIRFDWVIEEAFAEIPRWHPLVDTVIPVSLRRWRKGIFSAETRAGWQQLRQTLQAKEYDLVLDAQGLVKSAFLSFFTKGKRAGLNWQSARESLASLAYQQKHKVNFYQHAIVRMRALFSQALNYPLPSTAPNFGLQRHIGEPADKSRYLVLLHGTTWTTKQWPEAYWMQLIELARAAGYQLKIGGGNAEEVARATRIANGCVDVELVPYLGISAMAALLANAKGAVAVDTGFGHLAAALGIPTVSIYGATNPAYTGALGPASVHLQTQFACSPCLQRTCTYKQTAVVQPACYQTVMPQQVWNVLNQQLLLSSGAPEPQ